MKRESPRALSEWMKPAILHLLQAKFRPRIKILRNPTEETPALEGAILQAIEISQDSLNNPKSTAQREDLR